MEISYREANITDASALVDIYNAAFYSDYVQYGECPGYGRTVEDMEASIRKVPKYVILCDGKEVGCVSCKRLSEGEYEIGCLCVLPAYQGKGIGTRAMRFVQEQYADWRTITLVTPVDKAENVRFYTEKCGFSITAQETDGNVRVARFLLEKKALA